MQRCGGEIPKAVGLAAEAGEAVLDRSFGMVVEVEKC